MKVSIDVELTFTMTFTSKHFNACSCQRKYNFWWQHIGSS